MIDTQAIRNKILDRAMHGQLTEQLPEDGTAEELYQQIQEEKQTLIRAGKIKKGKSLLEVTKEDESFIIPANWKICRFGSIITLVSGTDFKPEEYNNKKRGIPYITGASNLLEAGVLINRWTETPRCIANAGDVLLVCKGSGYGKVAMCDVEEAHIARQIMAIKKTALLNMRYILYFLSANFTYLKGKGQGLIPGVDRNSVLSMIFPLPPLAEQQRIVDVIGQSFSILDTIDALQAQYTDNLTALKAKLIDAAIQGRLTEQLPEDGTAEELYQQLQIQKKRIEDSGVLKGRKKKTILSLDDAEFPFTIPPSWKWIRLDSVAEIYGRIGFRGYKKSDIVEQGKGALSLSPSNITTEGKCIYDRCTFITWDKYEESPEIMVNEEDVVIVKTGSSYGKCGVIKSLPEKATINPQLAILKHILCNRYYLHIVLNSTMARKQYESFVVGAATPTFSQENMANFILPLPPLPEQERIVKKLDEIFLNMNT